MPTQAERAEIFSVHLRKRKRLVQDFDVNRLAAESGGYVGSEIEQAIIDAMYVGFNENREFTTQDISKSLERQVPLSVSQRETVDALRDWLHQGRAQIRIHSGKVIMPGRLGVDFGTSNTVLAVWDQARGEGIPLPIAEYSRTIRYRQGGQAAEEIAVIPSLIHYAADQRRWLGQQVIARNLSESERTFRWMKRYIGRRSPIQVNVDGRAISHYDAGRDFLSAVLTFAVRWL